MNQLERGNLVEQSMKLRSDHETMESVRRCEQISGRSGQFGPKRMTSSTEPQGLSRSRSYQVSISSYTFISLHLNLLWWTHVCHAQTGRADECIASMQRLPSLTFSSLILYLALSVQIRWWCLDLYSYCTIRTGSYESLARSCCSNLRFPNLLHSFIPCLVSIVYDPRRALSNFNSNKEKSLWTSVSISFSCRPLIESRGATWSIPSSLELPSTYLVRRSRA